MRPRFFFILFCLLIIGIPYCPSQDLAGLEQGVKPFGTYEGGNIDAVSMTNLGLTVHIPIVSYPQRGGKLHLGFSLVYTTPTLSPKGAQRCNGGGAGYNCFPYNVKYSVSLNSGMILGQDFVPTVQTNPLLLTEPSCTSPNCVTSSPEMYDYTVLDAIGASHYMAQTSLNDASGWISRDTTGFVLNPLTGTLLDRRGIKFSYGPPTPQASGLPICCGSSQTPITIEDTNGNQIASTAIPYGDPTVGASYLNWTDTLGRVIPSPPYQSLSDPHVTSDYSNCSGSVPTAFATTWSIPGPNGETNQYKICYATITAVNNPWGCTDNANECSSNSQTMNVMQSLVLPNLTTWTFSYDTMGPLSRITFPTGGSIAYQWGINSACMPPLYQGVFPYLGFSVTARIVDANDGTGPHTWSYNGINSYDGNGFQIAVTDASQNDTVHTMSYLGTGCKNVYETELDDYAGSYSTGALLEKTITTYSATSDPYSQDQSYAGSVMNIVPTSIVTSDVHSGLTKSVTKSYDGGIAMHPRSFGTPSNPGTALVGDVTQQNEFEYGNGAPGGLLRQTNTTYMALSGPNASAYLANNLLNLPYTVQIKDGAGSQIAYTEYNYDESSLASSGLSASNSFDSSPSTGSMRGNNTSIQKWLNAGIPNCPNGQTGGISSMVTNRSTYYNSGTVATATEPCGGITNYTYSMAYQGAFPTTVTNAASQSTTNNFDFNTGLLASTTDANTPANTTTNSYDSSSRLVGVTYPDGGVSSYCYSDSSYGLCAGAVVAPSVLVSRLQSQGVYQQEEVDVDGLGREVKTRILSDPEGVDYVDTTYDALGRVYSKSNPYRGASGTNLTTFAYDALGRKVAQQNPDSTYRHWCYNGLGSSGQTCAGNASSRSNAAWVDFYDEAGLPSQQFTDGLGRLTAVMEPDPQSGNLALETDYTYDVLSNLRTVDQLGKAGDTPRPQRKFTYDSLSRLLTSYNPETGADPNSGIICYGHGDGTLSGCQADGYDANGNLTVKTDARGITTSFTYDALNRLTAKTYSDGTPSACFAYDGNLDCGLQTSYTISNTIGRLSGFNTSDNLSGKEFGYDAMGRINAVPTCWSYTCGGQYWTAQWASYDLAGNQTYIGYPDGTSVNQTFDGAGRLATVTASNVFTPNISQTIVQSVTYGPDGSPNVTTLGNGIQQVTTRNTRLQVSSVVGSGSSQTFFSHSYCYSNCTTGGTANNGNIWGISDDLNPSRTQGFTYDALNRIGSFSLNGAPRQQYTIDSFGNVSFPTSFSDSSQFTPQFNAQNRISNLPAASVVSGSPYDAAGNLLYDSDSNQAIRKYTWDAESRISQIAMLNSTTPFERYGYGADGSRAWKLDANGAYSSTFDWNGNTISEVDGPDYHSYIYANGQKVASLDTFQDHQIQISADGGSGGHWQWYDTGASQGYTIRAGDKLTWRQYQSATARGGMAVFASNGATVWTALDQNGTVSNAGSITGQWDWRVVDLSSLVGGTISNVLAGLDSPTTGPSTINLADISLVSMDGTVQTIYNGKEIGLTPYSGNNSMANAQAQFISTPPPGTENNQFHYFLNDALGTSQIEFSAAGWPVWQGQFAPYGGELDNQATQNNFKFTGKERDTESGLDYFGARYYASSMGRFMSPDWSAKEDPVPYASLDNPQSLNLYGYVGNNPLSRADADGHCCQAVSDFFSGWGGAVGSDIAGGLTPRGTPDSAAGRLGAVFGDVHAAVQGGLEVAVAVAGEGVGTALDATGVGVIPGVAINIGSAALGVHGLATASAGVVAMGRGSYTNTHQSGKTYSGKGDKARSQASGKRVEKATGDKHVATDHTPASSDRESFKDESRRIDANGGAGSSSNHNQMESPGKNYRQQDGSH